ncbi:MAG: signal recognition particle receptor subunit alpha, partial [Pseudomonadota bacterium]|nr:signal recognition particle receptor subunit alpha [Pseudomonadota bacterium]
MRWPWQRKKDLKPAPEQVVETPAAEEEDDIAALVRATVPDDDPEATPEPVPEPEPEPEPERKSWLARLTGGLAKSSARLTGGIVGAFNRRKLDDDALEELEEALIMADFGAAPAAKIVADFAKTRFDKEVTDEEIREALAEQITKMLLPVEIPLEIDTGNAPHVILVVGVNGSGKTTTIGKLSQHFTDAGHS